MSCRLPMMPNVYLFTPGAELLCREAVNKRLLLSLSSTSLLSLFISLLLCYTASETEKDLRVKALSHCVMFRATCLATPLRDKLHETLHSVTTFLV